MNLIAGEPIKLPRGGNVFNFVKSDLTGKGSIYTTMLTPYEHLEVFDAQGTPVCGRAMTISVEASFLWNGWTPNGIARPTHP